MRILLVEDEHKIAQAIKEGLEQEKYAVDVCFDGIKGYDYATSEDYDLIILDRMLSGMEGSAICEKLRSNGIHTPILMLTAKGQLLDKIEGFNKGADDYLVKPFAFEELLARIRALSRRPKNLVDEVLKVDALRLNTKTFEVTREKKPIQLSSREFALLEYLMRHKNMIVTKEQIIAHVWSYDSDILPNTVEVYIGYLRNKIDKGFPEQKQLIKTVRGFGYKIVDS